MGKICLVAFHDLYLMQFLYKYTEILDDNNIEYDVVFWEREKDAKIARKFKGGIIKYSYQTSYYGSKLSKVRGYLKYISFVKKTIRSNGYSKAILFTTQAAFPMYLFCRELRKKIRYIYDYRDLTFEKYPFCKKIIQRIISNSEFTSISSMGFAEVLGQSEKLIISHNASKALKFEPVEKTTSDKIRIVFWGMVRQVEFNKKVIRFFGGDDRFELVYHGDGYVEELMNYCNENNYTNVLFTGRYTSEQICGFVADTDVLLNLYENDYQQKLALTVKLYDAMRYGLPMLIAKDSYMHKLMSDNDYAAFVDLENDKTDMIYDWISKLSVRENPYKKEIERICEDDKAFVQRLLEFAKKE